MSKKVTKTETKKDIKTEAKKQNRWFAIIIGMSVVMFAIIAFVIWYVNADPSVKLCDYKSLKVTVDYDSDSLANMPYQEAAISKEEKVRQAVLKEVVDKSSFYHIMKSTAKRYDEYLKYYSQMAGLYEYNSVEELAVKYYGYKDFDEFDNAVQAYAELAIKQEIALKEIAKKEGFSVTDEIFNKYIGNYLEAYNYKPSEVDEFLENYGRADVYEVILNDFTLDMLVSWTEVS